MNYIRRIKKYIHNLRNIRIPRISLQGLKVLEVSLCLAIFFSGLYLGTTDLDPNSFGNASIAEKIKIVYPIAFPLLIGGLFSFVLDSYVQGNLSKNKAEFEAQNKNKNKEHEAEIVELKRKLDNSVYRMAQELEFLSMLFKDLKSFPENFNYRAFCPHINLLHSTSKLIKELKNYDEHLKYREEILKGFEKGFSEEENGNVPFYQLIGEACNHALKIEDPEEWARPFYSDMLVYLKAWLVCSIRHGVSIPIEPFYNEILEGSPKGAYQGKESYIHAIKYIRDVVLIGQEIKQFFPSSNSIKIIHDHLEELIIFLEIDRATENITEGYATF